MNTTFSSRTQVLTFACLAIISGLVLLVLFEPGLNYHITPPTAAMDSSEFASLVAAASDSHVNHAESIDVLTNGNAFYPSELAAIGAARSSVHLVAFIFHPSPIGDRFLAALIERAEAGVRVRVLVDAVGSSPTSNSYFEPLRAAGGIVAWYQPILWSTLKRFNNRTHREIIVIDGTIGFVGGASIASHWLEGEKDEPPWRDTMLKVTGGLAVGLQTAFAQNWLESAGEILIGPETFPRPAQDPERIPGMVVISAPSPAHSSKARVLFQTLLASARKSIDINSPYFLPDERARQELIAAVARGVRVRIITPGQANNHPMARRASRRRYGELLIAGVEVYEFQPGMIHAKILLIDGQWAVAGSTNFDSRSFDLNDEVNLAALDRDLVSRLSVDFAHDLIVSQRITYDAWQNRPWTERLMALGAFFLERQE